MGDLYVQYGCGFTAPQEWINFDSSPTLRWERLPVLGRLYTKNERRFPESVRYGDIVKGLPVADGSCRGIFASHVLEHLALDDFHIALRNTLRLLASGGVFRLVVPNLEWAAREYVRRLDSGDSGANEFLLEQSSLGRRTRRRGLGGLLHAWLGGSIHLWMWDAPSLQAALARHGFTRIRQGRFNDCEDPMFRLVEDPSRFENAVAMEARKA